MKKLLLVLAAVLLIAPSAFALQCKNGNYGSDECWTNVVVSLQETTPVVQGSVLVYDYQSNSGNVDTASYQVRVADASADWNIVAGVAQSNIATGDSGLVLVRGQGKIRTKTTFAITSGDALYVSTSADSTKVVVTGAGPVANALVTTSASGNTSATIDAYITIV